MIILSIDPSLTETGYAVLRGKKLLLTGHITTTPKTAYMQRLHDIYQEIYALCKKHKPQLLAIETQYLSGIKGNSVLKLSEVKGIIIAAYWSATKQYNVLEVNPKTVKSFIKLPTNAKRQDAKQAALAYAQRFDKNITNDNEADAFIIGLYAFQTETS